MKKFLRSLGDGIDRVFGSLRSSVDLTPWDKSGSSFMGLKRNQAKWLAWILLFFGISMADPPGGLLPDDFINLFIAGLLTKYFGVFSMGVWLVLTYTLFAYTIILLAVWIYPANTGSVLAGVFTKIKTNLKKALRNPIIIFVALVFFYFSYRWFKGALGV